MELKRSYGRILLVSVLVLYLEATLAVVVGVLYVLTREPLPTHEQYAEAVGAFTTLTVVFTILGLLLSLVVVLPAVALSDLLGRLIGGRDAWGWVPATVGALFAPLAGAALAGGTHWTAVLVPWAVATAVLSSAALLSRPRREGLLGLVATRGTALVVGTGLLGTFALWTDIVPRYRPPLINAAAVVGTWHDGRGGLVTFEADGRVTAMGISDFRPGDGADDIVPACSGPGTYTYKAGRTTWGQRVDVDIAGCSPAEWRVAGRSGHLELYQYVGDPEAEDRYELKKSR
ncbi:hypothetical protein ABZ128_13090 [Streptomyces sp. NPDC006326]|uniref:hypothetical protein n=1 Tax=Streptomyces sp. NPDC006326 TaxID=3156752 RepID=UPI0033A1A555